MDTHNPLHGLTHEGATAFLQRCKVASIKPVANALMYEQDFWKDRENRKTWPANWSKDGEWVVWSSTAEVSGKRLWAKWEEFLGETLPWSVSHAFSKCAVTGMAFITPPLGDEDLSPWCDTSYGACAMVLTKLLQFDGPITGIDNPQGLGVSVCSINQREKIVEGIRNRLRRGTYSWIWTALDDLGFAMPLADKFRRRPHGSSKAGPDPHYIDPIKKKLVLDRVQACTDEAKCLSLWCERCYGRWCTCCTCLTRHARGSSSDT